MANPKRRWSKARTGKRRSQWKLAVPELIACPQCHALKLPHKICKECGFYDGKEVLKKSADVK